MKLADMRRATGANTRCVFRIPAEPKHKGGEHVLLRGTRIHAQAGGFRKSGSLHCPRDHYRLPYTHQTYGDAGSFSRGRVAQIDAHVYALRIPPEIGFRGVSDPDNSRLIQQRGHRPCKIRRHALARYQQADVFRLSTNLRVGAQKRKYSLGLAQVPKDSERERARGLFYQRERRRLE